MQFVETGADFRFVQGRQLRVVVQTADVIRNDAEFFPATLVVGHLAPAMFDQALELAPLQGGNLPGIEPLAGLVLAQVFERLAPAQSALVQRKQDMIERGFVAAAHGRSRAAVRPDHASSRARARGRPPVKR